MTHLVSDARHALRMVGRAPGFSALLIGILALGVAASVAVFSLTDGVLLRPLPYRDPERLVALEAFTTKPPFDSSGSLSYVDFEELRTNSRSLQEVAATYRTGWSRVTLTVGESPEAMQVAFVTPNFFSLFGCSPLLGRLFTPEENRRRERVVVLGRSLAAARFGSPEQAVGRDLEIGRSQWRVIGV